MKRLFDGTQFTFNPFPSDKTRMLGNSKVQVTCEEDAAYNDNIDRRNRQASLVDYICANFNIIEDVTNMSGEGPTKQVILRYAKREDLDSLVRTVTTDQKLLRKYASRADDLSSRMQGVYRINVDLFVYAIEKVGLLKLLVKRYCSTKEK
jgi:hypothetical protein